jgi:hypothetical protein
VKYGFTGTQIGMSDRQKEALRALFERDTIDEFHHGDCVGADYEAHVIVWGLTFGPTIVIHPPTIRSKRAFCFGYDHPTRPRRWRAHGIVQLPAKPYLDRNHDIVDQTDTLIAAPRTNDEEQRSGTWATVRYARRLGRPIIMLER